MMTRLVRYFLVTAASFAAICNPAQAERVKWQALGVVTAVGSNASTLPFSVTVGQSFTIEMELENNGAAVTGGPSAPDMAAYNNIFKASVIVGGREMLITPSVPGTTTLWNDHVIGNGLPAYDYYSMPLVDAATQWEARWAVQVPIGVSTGPLNSLSLLQTPPNLSAFTNKSMTLTPGGGSPYAPAITASLDSLTVVNASSASAANDVVDAKSGGGSIDVLLLIALGVTALRRYRDAWQ